jgi:ribonucleoside-diphosphate reductase alpha chain
MSISLEPVGRQVTQNAKIILEKRYLKKDQEGNVAETPDEMYQRVANHVAQAELNSKYWADIYCLELLAPGIFQPNSPVLMNFGLNNGTGSGCYVLDIEDSMMGILDSAKEAIMIEKFGGGVGFSLSGIRPEGLAINSTQGYACGPIAVLRYLSEGGRLVTQAGRRDGAHMAVMSVYHPDIEKFIDCKKQEGAISNFNISVGVDTTFMEAVEEEKYLHLTWPVCTKSHTRKRCQSRQGNTFVKAQDIFQKIVNGAWANGEPGMVWLDRMNMDNATPALGEIKTTNPCGEQPLLAYESCNLGSIDVGKLVRDGKFDEARFKEVIQHSVNFLDNVIDVNHQPTENTAAMGAQTRKIGLGIMGFADLLVRLNIKYNSSKAVAMADRVGRILQEVSDQYSSYLGELKGDFPAFEDSPMNEKQGGSWRHMRNAWRRSIAPTGSIAMIVNASYGIEPLFGLMYKKQNMSASLEGIELYYINEDVRQLLDEDTLSQCTSDTDIKDHLTKQQQGVFVTASEIAPSWHLAIQATFQKYIDSGVSKTINLPNSATLDDVGDIYFSAYRQGCKGITVYRENSRQREVLVKNDKQATFKTSRPKVLAGLTDKINTGHGSLFVTLNSNGKPHEVISNMGKSGGCHGAYLEAISRLVSLALQSDIAVEQIIERLEGITCCPTWDNGIPIYSPADAIAKGMKEHFLNQSTQTSESRATFATNDKCNSCNGNLVIQAGCPTCPGCGWSKCG